MLNTPYKRHLEYPQRTMFQMIERIAQQYPDEPAYELYGRKTTYAEFIRRIERAARAFTAMGIRRDDRVTICMPNVPQALDCFYALNRIGAAANMIHPQSAVREITFYLNISGSRTILTLDLFAEPVAQAVAAADHPVTVLFARMQDELPPHLAALYFLKAGRKHLRLPDTGHTLLWKQFLKKGTGRSLPDPLYEENHTAAILYSGGTSGIPKGICLTDLNFNACAMQAREAIQEEFRTGLSMLACMPVFHGFGLGINIHAILMHGPCCVLMPTFNAKSYADILIKRKPSFIAGVPTIFDALMNIPALAHADLSFLKGVFCGGDSLSVELKLKIDRFLKEHGADVQIREGYGLTECVTASCLTPKDTFRPGSIGLPFPDTVYAIVQPGTDDIMPDGAEGEIILRGPTVMKGYLDNEEETSHALRRLPDGNIWLYTGDLGHIDEDGYLYFHQRIKRMIITNGYNVYPGQLENIIDGLPEVAYSCVIGVKDPRRMQRVRAYVVLREPNRPSAELEKKIIDALRDNIASYALPKELIFRESLPKTLVGKVAYRLLEEEAAEEEP